ncbi:MAG: hypothetical protein IT324_10290, partial [Anaerolineae bacterium]|nr:hypothetical protein [Anaerolineae bacterium]
SVIEALVLIASGGGLFFLSDIAQTQWPWQIPMYATKVVGATYLSSLVAVLAMLFYRQWSPARLVLWMIFAFTSLVLVVSLLYLNVFNFSRWATWGWFILYIALPVNSAYHLWLYRRLKPVNVIPASRTWRIYLFMQGLLAFVFAFNLLLFPSKFIDIWPGRFDEFHGQLYSAIFITATVGSWIVALGASRAEWIALGVTQTVLAFFMLLGVVLVAASLPSGYILEFAPAAYLWVALFGMMLVSGVIMLVQRVVQRSAVPAAEPSLSVSA